MRDMKKRWKYGLLILLLVLCLAGCGVKEPMGSEKDMQESLQSGENEIVPEKDEQESSQSGESEIVPEEERQEPLQSDETELLPEGAETPSVSEEKKSEDDDIIQKKIDSLTLEEKVAQLFIVCPEALIPEENVVTTAGDRTKEAFGEIPVGGFIYMAKNLENTEQTKAMIENVQTYSQEQIGLPAFVSVDEEGGSVARISGTGKFGIDGIEDMAEVGASGDLSRAYEIGQTMGTYLSDLGFNVDFAPVADVLTNPDNQVVKKRSFGADAVLVAQMTKEVRRGLEEQGVYAVYKHFPGHGMTAEDSHKGYAYSDKTLEELEANELVPFQAGIEEGVHFIMVGHISLPSITGDNTPASLSKVMITDVLREKMNYEGIIITDALNMGAIVNEYSSAEASIKVLEAGADIILMPENFLESYEGVLQAVEEGRLTEERIDESLRRILTVKWEILDTDLMKN